MKLKIHTQIIIAIVLGIIIGLAFPQFAQKLQIIGDLFIKLLKMIIVPLILASMVTGIISIGSSGGPQRVWRNDRLLGTLAGITASNKTAARSWEIAEIRCEADLHTWLHAQSDNAH